MKVKEYEVTLKCAVLMTSRVVKVSATSEEEAVDMARSSSPYSTVVGVNEVKDAD